MASWGSRKEGEDECSIHAWKLRVESSIWPLSGLCRIWNSAFVNGTESWHFLQQYFVWWNVVEGPAQICPLIMDFGVARIKTVCSSTTFFSSQSGLNFLTAGHCLVSKSWVEADFVALQKKSWTCTTEFQLEIIVWVCIQQGATYKTSNCALKCHVIFIVIKYSHVNFKLKLGSQHIVWLIQSALQVIQVARCIHFSNIH
jgi:hypothetical protein